jgi:ERCC4-related helicase
MVRLNPSYVYNEVAGTQTIYKRGEQLYATGAFIPVHGDGDKGRYEFRVDGRYGDYTIRVDLDGKSPRTSCDCPYPGEGCKHVVAALLYLAHHQETAQPETEPGAAFPADGRDRFLTPAEIRDQAVKDRENRAQKEKFGLKAGEMYKGAHLVTNLNGRAYTVTLHNPSEGIGHCTCPDYLTNRLGTCKHLIFTADSLRKQRGFEKRLQTERFPFIDLHWDSVENAPRVFAEQPHFGVSEEREALSRCFDESGRFHSEDFGDLMTILPILDRSKRVKIQPEVLRRLELHLEAEELAAAANAAEMPTIPLKAELYPYQLEGVRFALHRSAALIGDEMGLGKTLQAIAVAILKAELFGFQKVLVVTLASLKEQWRREIERFSRASAVVVAGTALQRRGIYRQNAAFVKITNYEAVLRDETTIAQWSPDLVILDEAQRIKNFTTKTAAAIKRLPRRHALVLTGTPLENRLEDIYSIAQFLDPQLLSPLWQFAADHFMLSRTKKNKIEGYRNLERLNTKLKCLVLRRRKEEVLQDLPDQVVNTYFVAMTPEQYELHDSYRVGLASILRKKFLTPMDIRRIHELLLRMRQACNSTYLIDRETNISPKLDELASILDELVVQNGRKLVLFSEWTTMTYLIARQLSEAKIGFVELSGKVPVKKRQALIDTFTNDPDCRVFLSTDAGGTGLNLQAADCVVNFELPWNPARLNQRIGRVNRIGQRSRCINVVNLVSKGGIEERIMAGLKLKLDLFESVFQGGADTVTFSQSKREELLNQLRDLVEEPAAIPSAEVIPEDTPHFMNPAALAPEMAEAAKAEADADTTEQAVPKAELDITGEENIDVHQPVSETTAPQRSASQDGTPPAAPSPEKIEAVLNQGFGFLSGLMEMATGQPLASDTREGRLVALDRETGEVTLKFKLPNFK